MLYNQIGFSQLEQYDWSSVKYINTTNGLLSNFTDCLLQDSRGFLWFVTYNGTVRYDGMSFKKYEIDINDSNSINPDWFRNIVEDKNGIIWIASGSTGIYSINPVNDKLMHFH